MKMMIYSVFLLAGIWTGKVVAFQLMSTPRSRRESLHSGVAVVEEYVIDDPYSDVFNFDLSIEKEAAASIKEESSIAVRDRPLVKFEDQTSLTVRRKEYKDDFIEEEIFAAADEKEILEREKFYQELQDKYEKVKGRAIWSDKQQARPERKRVVNKNLRIPPEVREVINIVYLERICKFRELSRTDGFKMVAREYIRWLREQYKRLDRDVLPQARVQLSQEWLKEAPCRHLPIRRMRDFESRLKLSKRIKTVVLDEVSNILDFTANQSINFSGSEIDKTGKISNTTSAAPLQTNSIVNWNKSQAEMEAEGALDVNKDDDDESSAPVFKIDDELMFIPNQKSDEYFVVL